MLGVRRLLSLLALAFRSHQLYFSHAHDVTHTLQSLGVSASRAPGSAPEPALARSCPSVLNRQGSETRSSWTPLSSSDSSTGCSPGGAMMGGPKITAKRRIRGKKKLKQQKDQDLPPRGLWRGSSKEKRGRVSPSACSEEMMNTSTPPPDSRFFWNLGVLGAFLDLRDQMDYGGNEGDLGGKKEAVNGRGQAAGGGLGAAGVAAVDRWLTPVMSGFLQVERGCRVGERGFDVLFVSRRSRLRQGTRFTRRGVDGGGNVANFVETEQARHDKNMYVNKLHVTTQPSPDALILLCYSYGSFLSLCVCVPVPIRFSSTSRWPHVNPPAFRGVI